MGGDIGFAALCDATGSKVNESYRGRFSESKKR